MQQAITTLTNKRYTTTKSIKYRVYRDTMSPRKYRASSYQVCITILEARHLPQNANPLVVVKVGNRKRKTVVRERTDTPIYNEYFVFDLFCELEELLSTKIMIAVYLKTHVRLKFHASTSFEVALVWEQPDRQYHHKWAMLTNPKDLIAGPKGYVKCNIAINVKGEKLKVHPEVEGEDDIEGNLLLPVGGESIPFRQHARYIFVIYRADGLPDMSSLCVKSDFENINPFVQISFAGMKVRLLRRYDFSFYLFCFAFPISTPSYICIPKSNSSSIDLVQPQGTCVHDQQLLREYLQASTSEAWQTYGPRFNEKITFKEMFPSLCQRVRITIKHRIDSCRTCVVASHILDMSKISNSGEHGFLPTFGPSFLHFYSHEITEKIYRGRVLFSLKTEMDDPEASSGVGAEIEPIAPIIEVKLNQFPSSPSFHYFTTYQNLQQPLITDVTYTRFNILRGSMGPQNYPTTPKNIKTHPPATTRCNPVASSTPLLTTTHRSLWSTEEYYLVAVLYDVSLIDRRKFSSKSISFEVSIGNAGNRRFPYSQCFEDSNEGIDFPTSTYFPRRFVSYPRQVTGIPIRHSVLALQLSTVSPITSGNRMPERRTDFESGTVPRMTGSLDGKYNYLPLGSRKPCLLVKSYWPNLEWRMHNSNNLAFVADFLILTSTELIDVQIKWTLRILLVQQFAELKGFLTVTPSELVKTLGINSEETTNASLFIFENDDISVPESQIKLSPFSSGLSSLQDLIAFSSFYYINKNLVTLLYKLRKLKMGVITFVFQLSLKVTKKDLGHVGFQVQIVEVMQPHVQRRPSRDFDQKGNHLYQSFLLITIDQFDTQIASSLESDVPLLPLQLNLQNAPRIVDTQRHFKFPKNNKPEGLSRKVHETRNHSARTSKSQRNILLRPRIELPREAAGKLPSKVEHRFQDDFNSLRQERKLEELEELVELEDTEAYKAYNEAIRELKGHCIHYLHTLDGGRYDEDGGTTKLDRHRVNLCRKEIENILKRIKINGELPSNHYMRIAMAHAYQYLRRVKRLREDPQHSLPDVFVWMIAGSRRVACARLTADEIIYSEEKSQKGSKCGQKVDIFMRDPREDDEADYSACKVELFLWLGNANYLGACWSSIPPGYEVDHERGIDYFPMHLEYTRSSAFQLRAHIFQGRFDPGMDASGLLDPLVRVAFHGYTATTKVIKQTLDPFWDQTLILPPRTVHGTKEYIKEHPPKVVLQVFDQDIGGSKEFCGRCSAIPLVKLAEETYSSPDFPPKLEWYKFKSQRDCSGSVLAAFELIEICLEDETADEPMDTSEEATVYNIPEDIRPKMASYRLEVIFWGVRDMKKINYMPVLRPRIIIECAGVHVKSEVMENAKKFSNFEDPHVMVELEMPELNIYYPSITIKAYDSRGFGCFKYAGICIIPSVYVFLEQLITEEDYDIQIHEAKSILKSPWSRKQPTTIYENKPAGNICNSTIVKYLNSDVPPSISKLSSRKLTLWERNIYPLQVCIREFFHSKNTWEHPCICDFNNSSLNIRGVRRDCQTVSLIDSNLTDFMVVKYNSSDFLRKKIFQKPLLYFYQYAFLSIRFFSKKEFSKISTFFLTKSFFSQVPLPIDYDPSKDENKGLIPYKRMTEKNFPSRIQKILRYVKKVLAYIFGRRRKKARKKKADSDKEDEDKSLDWWSKYFASLEVCKHEGKELVSRLTRYMYIATNPVVKRDIFRRRGANSLAAFLRKIESSRQRSRYPTSLVYDGELEMQSQFAAFQDRLRPFELWKGRKSEDPDYDGNNYVGKFKGHICVYRWPPSDNVRYKTRSGRSVIDGLFDDYPSQEPVKVLVRLYVVKGLNLQPSDPLSGKSDPYLCVKLGKTFINDRKNYIPNQLNPTFGRLFELEATFPLDYMMIVQVWDFDATSSDDLIGETKIDLENRFYSQHRATCGIARIYSVKGYNRWRDREKPTQILDHLCRKNNLPLPEYRNDHVRIGRKRFFFIDSWPKNEADREECMALNVLHQWQDFPICGCVLVPEHVERRPLFNVARPGLEQGKLELWIDMFQFAEIPPKPAIDISPLLPVEYEIRVVVWNTEDVPLVDSQFLTGEKCSDIYVKGWITYDNYQKTDIHYNSLNGEGNFNWRFIFRVTYSKGERVMIVRRKISVLARSETEEKLPCKLYLQVWDNDHFSPDDFLGALTLDLARMPRGSANSKNCTLKLLKPSLPTIDLFKVTRTKAWWPFVRSVGAQDYVQAGKVELEMSILPATEAEEQPAGRGRDPPQSLPPPNRPDTSFSWFRNPWKAFRFVVCRYYKWRIIFFFLFVLLFLLVACAIYAFPGYLVKRLLGA
ncbi:fer-1-like protein 6 [Calliopsis andreniformis]|uniref:fer-1-like protein 6 n=1 Tax=Calliopsis andreniformis TaxID=337506 RepID=UPI003FCEAEFC